MNFKKLISNTFDGLLIFYYLKLLSYNRKLINQTKKGNKNIVLISTNFGLINGSGCYIGNNLILTAAHCVKNKSNIRIISEKKIYTPKNIYIHPRYNKNNHRYDIAIIRTKENIVGLKGLKLNFKDQTSFNYCRSVGYTLNMPISKIYLPTLPISLSLMNKYSIKIPHVYKEYVGKKYYVLSNIVGFEIVPETNKFRLEKVEQENNTQQGMSGGPLLLNNEVIGVTSGMREYFYRSEEISKYKNGYKFEYKRRNLIEELYHCVNILLLMFGFASRETGKSLVYTPISSNSEWIKKIVNENTFGYTVIKVIPKSLSRCTITKVIPKSRQNYTVTNVIPNR